MAGKVPTAEEVIALVAAATAPDGGLEPTMQQLLLQVQAQQSAAADAALSHAAPAVDAATAQEAKPKEESQVVPMEVVPLTGGMGSPTVGGAAAVEVAVDDQVDMDMPSGPGAAVKRKSIPLSMKKEAIEWIMGPGKGVPSRAEKHFSALNWEVSASSFRKWWKNRDKILGDSSSKKRISGGGRKPYLEDAEEKLLVVVIQERAKKDRVTRKWIAKTAQHMFQRSNMSFKASENWVTKFIRRNGLTLKRSYVTYEQSHPPSVATGPSDASAANVPSPAEAATFATTATPIVAMPTPPDATATVSAMEVTDSGDAAATAAAMEHDVTKAVVV